MSPVRFLPVGSQLHEAGKQRAGPRTRTKLAGQTSSPLPSSRKPDPSSSPRGSDRGSAVSPPSTPNVCWRSTGGFSKLLVRYFRKATQEQLPHVDVLCRTLVITVDVLLPLRLLQNSITRKLEPEMSGHRKYKHGGRTPSCPQQERGVCFYPELDIAGKEDLDSVQILVAGNGRLKDRMALSPRH